MSNGQGLYLLMRLPSSLAGCHSQPAFFLAEALIMCPVRYVRNGFHAKRMNLVRGNRFSAMMAPATNAMTPRFSGNWKKFR